MYHGMWQTLSLTVHRDLCAISLGRFPYQQFGGQNMFFGHKPICWVILFGLQLFQKGFCGHDAQLFAKLIHRGYGWGNVGGKILVTETYQTNLFRYLDVFLL